jgi:hypothetical protein
VKLAICNSTEFNMPIDASIPLQAKNPQIESPMNQLAMMSDAMKIGEMQRGLGVQNELRNLYSQGVDVSTPEGFKRLASVDPASAIKLRRDALEGRRLQAETGLKEFELDTNKINKAINDVANHDTPEAALASIKSSVDKGILAPDKAQALITSMQNIPFRQWQSTQISNLLNAKDRLTLETTRRGQDIQAGTTRRGQDMQYAPNVVANTVTDAAGNVTQFNRFGEVIGKPGAVGKPSATFEKTAALQKQQGRDLGLAITELESATKDKGLIDQSTGSGIGRLADVSAGFVGQATPGAIAIAKLKPIADMALKMVPRFEGPQSDKDTQSYKEAAGQLADPSLPTDLRKAAGKEVLRLMKARKNQFVNETMANEGIGASGGAGVDTSNPLLK